MVNDMRDPYSNIQKSNWRAERFHKVKVNKYRSFGRSIVKWFAIGTLFLSIEGCIHPSHVVVSPHRIQVKYKFVTDSRQRTHKYRKFPRVHSGDITVQYCSRHKQWETISARWTKHGILRFNVTRHRRDNRW